MGDGFVTFQQYYVFVVFVHSRSFLTINGYARVGTADGTRRAACARLGLFLYYIMIALVVHIQRREFQYVHRTGGYA